MITFFNQLKYYFILIFVGFLFGCDQGSETLVELAGVGFYDAKLSDSGDHVVVASIAHGGSFWQRINSQYERKFNWNHKAGEFTEILKVDIAKDGSIAATCNIDECVFWDGQSGQSLGFWRFAKPVQSISISGQSNKALVGLTSALMYSINLRGEGSENFEFLVNGEVQDIVLSRDGSQALIITKNNFIEWWALNQLTQVAELKLDMPLMVLTATEDFSQFIVSDHDGYMYQGILANDQIQLSEAFGQSIVSDDNHIRILDQQNKFLTMGENKRLKVFDLSSLSLLSERELGRGGLFSQNNSIPIDFVYKSTDDIIYLSSDGKLNLQ